MKFGIPAETRANETRVAATPETVKKLTASGHHAVVIQSGAGAGSSIPDEQFTASGATMLASAAEVYQQCDVVLKVRAPDQQELAQMRRGQILIGLLNPHARDGVAALAQQGITAFAMEALPRISRAQNMDVLSSQANIGGYKGVLLAAVFLGEYPRWFHIAGVLLILAGIAISTFRFSGSAGR